LDFKDEFLGWYVLADDTDGKAGTEKNNSDGDVVGCCRFSDVNVTGAFEFWA
jgi:hypothetical protein|tara:strand:- start:165 stop:320 length:156 start_codon:yes stop_codon:yes gene_type:complete